MNHPLARSVDSLDGSVPGTQTGTGLATDGIPAWRQRGKEQHAVSHVSQVDDAFRESLGLAAEFDVATAAYGKTDEWDSVAHMQLVAALEDAFGIMIETDDVIAMSDYA